MQWIGVKLTLPTGVWYQPLLMMITLIINAITSAIQDLQLVLHTAPHQHFYMVLGFMVLCVQHVVGRWST